MKLMQHAQEIKEMLEMMAQFSREHEELLDRLIALKEVKVSDCGEFLYWINSGKRVGVEPVISD